MLRKCQVCNTVYQYPAKTAKGLNLVPEICSARCLKEFILAENPGDPQDLFPFLEEEIQTRLYSAEIEWLHSKPGYYRKAPHLIFTQSFRHLHPQYKSDYEKEFATWMRICKLQYVYEPILFRQEYIPDFLIVSGYKLVFVEVKGLWQPSAYAKAKRFAKFIGEYGIPLLIIDKTILNLLKKRRVND